MKRFYFYQIRKISESPCTPCSAGRRLWLVQKKRSPTLASSTVPPNVEYACNKNCKVIDFYKDAESFWEFCISYSSSNFKLLKVGITNFTIFGCN